MPINKIPTKAFTTIDLIVDAFTATDGQTELSLSAPTTANACIVTVNDVLQVPTTDYTVSNSTLTFTSALALNDSVNVRILTRPVGFVPVTDEVDLTNYYTKAEVDSQKAPLDNPTFTGDVVVNGDLETITDFTFKYFVQDASSPYLVLDTTNLILLSATTSQNVTLNLSDDSSLTVTLSSVFWNNSNNELLWSWSNPPQAPGNGIEVTSIVLSGFGNLSIDNLSVDKLTELQQTTERFNIKTEAFTTVPHDFSTGAIWFHYNMFGNFTPNFINVPTTNNRTIVCTLILGQQSTAYIPNAIEVNGTSQTIRWANNTIPTGTSSGIDIVSFSLIRIFNSWTVLGSLSSYG